MRRSDNITAGPERMPNRSLLRACGMTDEEMKQPIIGVVSAYSEIIPGHINLDKIADAVKAGVRMAGGTPVLVPAIGVCDGIAMGHIGMKYSLASRELIADSVETLAQAHQLDGLVLIPNCDKIVPGMLMAAARLNIPSILVSGGPMLAGHFGGEEVSLSKTFEAVGAYKAGMMDEETFYEAECNSCPGCGSCAGMYTANSMNCLSEAIGMALPGNGTTPAVSAARIHLAKHAGMKIMELIEKDIKPRDILTPAAFRNALTCEMAIGCSTNSVLHLLAIANEAGVPLQLETLNELSGKVPNICHLAPAGPHHIEQLYMAGGVPAIMKELTKRDFLDLSLITCTGKTVGENLEGVVNKNPEDTLLHEIDPMKADLLFLPGGMPGTKNLMACKPLCDALVQAGAAGKRLAAICAAPSILGQLGLLKDKKATCYPGFEDALTGAKLTGAGVVTDGNITTARGLGYALDLGIELASLLVDRPVALQVKDSIQYDQV